jgi:hypothetical protein
MPAFPGMLGCVSFKSYFPIEIWNPEPLLGEWEGGSPVDTISPQNLARLVKPVVRFTSWKNLGVSRISPKESRVPAPKGLGSGGGGSAP